MIGTKIKQLREERRITQKELAAAILMGTTAINNYENGHRVPDADTVFRFAKYFGVSSDFLLGLSPYRNNHQHEAIDKLFQGLALETKNLCKEIQMALVEVASVYSRTGLHGLLASPELFSCLIDDLKTYISAYQHIIEGNSPETNLVSYPNYFVDQFITETSQAEKNLSKVVECIYRQGEKIYGTITFPAEDEVDM